MSISKYSRILTAVDFSAQSENLLARAVQLRDQGSARLSLLHVVEYLPMAYSGDLVLPEGFDLERELLDVATRQMASLGERLGVAESDRYVEVGNTGHTILRVAAELGADLILVGSHGRHGLATLLGSTARSVLNGAHCDVLAIRVPED
ncbi:MAG: universal stress protein [Chromatiaceae bacterium]